MKLCIVLVLLIVAGCATSSKLEEHLRARVGTNIQDVMSQYGAPDKSAKLPDGGMVYTWTTVYGANANSYRDLAGNIQTNFNQPYCDISYTTDAGGTIQRWSYYGTRCTSR